MTSPITIENEALRVQVYPGYGSKVASVIDKSDRYELMFSYPRELPTRADYDIDYGDGWYAGWDECFPGIAKGPYPLHPYEGISVPDHGELWGLPTQVQPSSEGILSRWRGIRFAYELSRHLRLRGSTLEAHYELEHFAPFDFHFVWAMHSLMQLNQAVELSYGGASLWRLSHDAKGTPVNRGFEWPGAADANFSRPSELTAGGGWKIYSAQPIDQPFVVRYPQRGRKLEIGYESDDLAAYWGVWMNTGGWAGHRHFAVEPTIGRYDHLAASVQDQSAAKVGPLGKVSWTVRWTVG